MTDQPTARQPFADAIECAIGLNINCGGTDGVHRVRDAVLTAIEEHLHLGEAEAWCKTCRRVWDGPRHRCESDAEQRLALARNAVALHRQGLLTTSELYAVIEADALSVPCPACRRADQAGLAASEQHDDCAKEQR
ncbi:hypothetical protein [Streptomyces aureus]